MIRYATIDDAESVAEIYLGSFKRHVACAQLAHPDAEIRNWIKDILIPLSAVFVVEENQELTAFMTLTTRASVSWIEQLYTHPDRTNRGYGSDLLSLAKKVLPSPIQLYTFQENRGARRFYERAGFVAIKFSDGRTNEERCPDVLYEWKR